MLESQLLPAIPGLRMIEVKFAETRILVTAEVTSATAICPRCQQCSDRIHSRYQRKITDLPWAGHPVCIRVAVRRFLCRNEDCPQHVFCERLTPTVAVYARQSERLKAQLLALAVSMGGELTTSRILPQLGLQGSPAMLLNHLRTLPATPAGHVRVVGLDDWAKRKGQVYGTILVDLEQRQIIDLLDDRSTATVAAWLADHPEVEIISRDRFVNYAKAATQAAPNAVQVADRFHLVKNINEAVQRTLDRYSSIVRQATQTVLEPQPAPPAPQPAPAQAPPNERDLKNAPQVPTAQTTTETRVAKRFKEVKALKQKGMSERAIARKLGLNRRTVRRYVVHDDVPVRKLAPQSTSTVKPYMAYLRSRIADGCDNYTTLHQEITVLGFRGSYASVRRAVRPLLAPKRTSKPGESAPTAPKPAVNALSSRQATWLLVRQDAKLKPDEIKLLDALRHASPAIANLYQLAQDFHRIVRERSAKELDTWLATAHASDISELRHFAEGLVRDYSAVKSALTLAWSNGPVEASVNKLKLLKRQMVRHVTHRSIAPTRSQDKEEHLGVIGIT